MELLLLLVILPAVQDQNHLREWLKNAIRAWCTAAAWILDLRSYLFGDSTEDTEVAGEAADPDQDPEDNREQPQEVQEPQPDPEPQGNDEGLAAAHQALLQREGPLGYQPYTKPKMFPLLVS